MKKTNNNGYKKYRHNNETMTRLELGGHYAKMGLARSQVFNALARHCDWTTGKTTVSNIKLARRLGASTKTIGEHIKWLVEHGYLTKQARHNNSNINLF